MSCRFENRHSGLPWRGREFLPASWRLLEVQFHRGLYLPEPDLWLDPWDAKPHAFVSHAHADHFARHEAVLCSEVSAVLLQHRYKLAPQRLEAVAFHVPLVRDGFRLRLLPAGHIPGSAMLHITRLADNASLLYTGDFKTRRSRTAEAVNFLTAETLVMETTFGLPVYEFPAQLEIEADILRFIADGFADGETPVLLGYSLGKAQEALALLEEHGIPALLHPAAAAMTRACRDAGVPGLPEPLEFDGHAPPGHVVIAPPSAVRTDLLRGLKAKRTAMLSGWALQPGAKYRYRVDAMIPFSDHADFAGLLECVQRVRPRRVLTVHGYAAEFAADLRARQIDAWCATGDDQLELPIHRPAVRQAAARGPWHKRVACPLADFSDLCRLLADTGSRVAKGRFLTTYLAGLADDDALRTAVGWLASQAASGKNDRASLLDGTTLRHALAALPGARAERVREIHHAQRDPGRTARLVMQELHLRPEPLDLRETAGFIRGFREAAGSLERIHSLADRLATLHPAEGETLVKLLGGDLRLGIGLALVEEALAAAFGAELAEIRRAAGFPDHPGETAVRARHGRLAEARPPGPVSPLDPGRAVIPTTGEFPFPPECD